MRHHKDHGLMIIDMSVVTEGIDEHGEIQIEMTVAHSVHISLNIQEREDERRNESHWKEVFRIASCKVFIYRIEIFFLTVRRT